MAIIVIKRDRSIMQYEIAELDSQNVLKINPVLRAYLMVSWQRFHKKQVYMTVVVSLRYEFFASDKALYSITKLTATIKKYNDIN